MADPLRQKLAAGDALGAVVDFVEAMRKMGEAPASPRDGPAPVPSCSNAASTAPRQPPAAAHRNQRAASARRVAAGPRQAKFPPEPGAPAVSVEGAPDMTPAEAEEAEERAAIRQGLSMMNPRRRLLKEIYPAWADPTCWASRDELKAKTGYALEVTHLALACCRNRH